VQPPYSLFWRKIEKDLVPYCVEHNISILAYSPLAQGLLTGKFGPQHQFDPEDNRSKNQLFQGETYKRAQQALEKLRPLAEQHQTTLGNLALAWLMAQPQTHAIVGARNTEQAVQNAQAADVKLSAAELAEIDKIGRAVTDPLDDNPVMWLWSA
jgi:myo-inositol catabolism protein IolS